MRSSRSAVSPASGSAAAVTAGDRVRQLGQRSRSGPPRTRPSRPAAGCPTTRVPAAGPEPSAAAWTTRPATSLPGRQSGRGASSWKVSPRLTEYASTFTSASSGRGCGWSTSASSTDGPGRPVAVMAFMAFSPCCLLLLVACLFPLVTAPCEIKKTTGREGRSNNRPAVSTTIGGRPRWRAWILIWRRCGRSSRPRSGCTSGRPPSSSRSASRRCPSASRAWRPNSACSCSCAAGTPSS